MAVVLVGGGARSGKSRWALEHARRAWRAGGHLVYIATAQALDDEMRERIAHHRSERSADFVTVEEPLDLAGAIRSASGSAIVGRLPYVVAFQFDSGGRRQIDAEFKTAVTAARESSVEVILVTNEVGCGIVPENALAREFRDRAGIMNQRFADAADEVYWMVFGQPLRVK